jgi:hypothetical protein
LPFFNCLGSEYKKLEIEKTGLKVTSVKAECLKTFNAVFKWVNHIEGAEKPAPFCPSSRSQNQAT